MHWPRILLGVVLDLLGTIWLLQSLNVLQGSPMTGVPFWGAAGAALIIVGNTILAVSLRARSGPNI